ncbi:MAG TPA: hypothetical protein VJQ59_16680 [Candidatus Sulfotelmatobacter sp.]|nr:hypothetical protein [Candidatus Sulfotelmatobacter sp.]
MREDFDGGRLIAENFVYNGLVGGSYLPGKQFDITQPQVEQQGQFVVKYFEVNVTLSKEDIQVTNKGPNAMFRLIDSRMETAYMTLGAHLAISLYLNGQGNYTAVPNGLAEALNDGSTASWDNATYTSYGTLTRGGQIGQAYNSPPTNLAGGTIEYNTLEEVYGDATFGAGEFEPNIGITTVKGYSYMKEKFQTQQRFNDTQDPKIGFNGLKFNNSVIMKSRYAPGSYLTGPSGAGTNDPIAVTYLTQSTNGAVTAYPVGNLTNTGESLFFLNARKPFMNFYMTNDEEYGMGFTGFKPSAGNTLISGQVLLACNVTWSPRYHRQIYGFTG